MPDPTVKVACPVVAPPVKPFPAITAVISPELASEPSPDSSIKKLSPDAAVTDIVLEAAVLLILFIPEFCVPADPDISAKK